VISRTTVGAGGVLCSVLLGILYLAAKAWRLAFVISYKIKKSVDRSDRMRRAKSSGV